MAEIFPVVLVSGPRQAGKTALLRHVFPDAHYVSFDDPSAADSARTAPMSFLSQLGSPLILDEIQYVPTLFRSLKTMVDHPCPPGSFLLTGSQAFGLMQGVSESLAGRCGILTLHTLSMSESLAATPSLGVTKCMFRGGFPALHADTAIPVPLWFPSYVATYLERDIRNMSSVQDLGAFNRFVRACAFRTGQVLNLTDLARDVGIAPNTVRQWLSLLMASGIVALTEAYHTNLGKRLAKAPKLHFTDTGLACHLAGLSTEEMLVGSPLFGAFWETLVVGQICRAIAEAGLQTPVMHWRTPSGQEVDVVLEVGTDLVAIECKAGEHPDVSDTIGIRAMRRFYGDSRIRHAAIACRTPSDYVLDDGTRVVGIETLTATVRDAIGAT